MRVGAIVAGAARYRAFISYSHADQKQARWLQRALESYRVPARLVGRETATGVIQKRIGAIFRDRDELPVAADLSGEINHALDASQFLIVLCSPKAAASKWVNQEVINFKRLKGAASIIAVIVAGEPGAADPKDECFCPGLRFHVAADGTLSDTPAEPIAADLRPGKDPPRLVKMKVLAGLLGVGLDELIRRDNARRQKLTAYAMAASLAGMAAMTALAWSAMVARADAERRGRKAEELMEFLLTKMQVPLREVGRTQEFNEAVERTVGYYAGEKFASLADESLSRYGRALHLEAETRQREGKLDEALRAATIAADMTGAVLLRDPVNSDRITDHGQSEFWLGSLNYARGDMKQAIPHLEKYAELAEKASAARPDNLAWEANAARARSSLGTAFSRAGDLEHASQAFAISNAAWARIREAHPADLQARQSAAITLSLTSEVMEANGQVQQALSAQREALDLAETIYARQSGNNRDARARLANIERRVGRLAFAVGDAAEATQHLEKARIHSTALLALDPANMSVQASLGLTITDLASAALLTGDTKRAAAELARADLNKILDISEKAGVFSDRLQLQVAGRAVRARLSAEQNDPHQALALAETNVRDLAALGAEPPSGAVVLAAEAEVLVGDAFAQASLPEAESHWRRAAQMNVQALGPRATYTVMQALCRTGDREGASRLAAVLETTGYVRPLSAAVTDKCGN